MITPEPRAVEHTDNLPPSPPCETCGSARELVMLERFTGWWCRGCASQIPVEASREQLESIVESQLAGVDLVAELLEERRAAARKEDALSE